TLVQLDVYNLLGEKVMELINEEMPAGYHQTAFNAGSLSSGIYFYRIQAGTFTETRKMMLLK
ncbi:MAG: T9SS type A sorting domain-containing protein, partial [Ignavibacteria bacterium]